MTQLIHHVGMLFPDLHQLGGVLSHQIVDFRLQVFAGLRLPCFDMLSSSSWSLATRQKDRSGLDQVVDVVVRRR
ncbi:hypothetical protein N7539_006187 [Penicillium diatomitis]|uniref:Uncharacterized protein n=1 Tax=Penicillium diatomitis TaxID=2819901 RepID=A0A9X0BSS9_9EURO|nr:uncharacterized protein N7539_006187 [Penicillium diatomitis]KAJ5482741.1 hypothetical protein N7539_006187 [Penicillium diatomitis]